MIYSVHGKLLAVEPPYAVVEAAGVGYQCMTSMTTLSNLPPKGSEVFLYTHLSVREDGVELFGFADPEELRFFRMLLSVSGVGPKMALSVLSAGNPEKLMMSIAAGDAKGIRAPGVGPKIAQRIIMELHDKVGNGEIAALTRSGLTGGAEAAEPSAAGEAIAALTALGYSQTDAAAAVARLDQTMTSDQMIRQALKKLSRLL